MRGLSYLPPVLPAEPDPFRPRLARVRPWRRLLARKPSPSFADVSVRLWNSAKSCYHVARGMLSDERRPPRAHLSRGSGSTSCICRSCVFRAAVSARSPIGSVVELSLAPRSLRMGAGRHKRSTRRSRIAQNTSSAISSCRSWEWWVRRSKRGPPELGFRARKIAA
jgi:hypothetical protein